MRRRAFITLFGGAAAAWPLAAGAQQPARVWRVGYLTPSPLTDITRAFLEALRLRLQELGYVEGRNLILDERRADGDLARLPGLAVELVSLRPDVIVTVGTPPTAAAQKATSSIPIVMIGPADPVGSGFVGSLARPGGNITGLSYMSPDFTAKTLELLLSVVPGARRVAVLISANPATASLIRPIRALAQTLGVEILPVTWKSPADLDEAFENIGAENCDGLIVLADPNINRRIFELAAKTRVPAIYQRGCSCGWAGS